MSNLTAKEEMKTLVLGATGKTGSRVLQRLSQRKWPVKSGSRSGDPKFDWGDSTTWEPILRNTNAVYISFHPDLAVPGTVKVIEQFTKTAVKNGVQKLVLLSGRGEEEAQNCEEIVMNSGVDWTIVRASWFNQNFSEGNFLEPLLSGHLVLPAGNVGEPFVDTDDIADVAVVALTEQGHNGKLYEVTGPRLLTFKDAVGEIAKATGKSFKYEQVSMDDYKKMLSEYGVPDEFISFLTYLFSEVLDGRNAKLTNGVEQALGRKPTDFSEFVRKAAANGAWNNS